MNKLEQSKRQALQKGIFLAATLLMLLLAYLFLQYKWRDLVYSDALWSILFLWVAAGVCTVTLVITFCKKCKVDLLLLFTTFCLLITRLSVQFTVQRSTLSSYLQGVYASTTVSNLFGGMVFCCVTAGIIWLVKSLSWAPLRADTAQWLSWVALASCCVLLFCLANRNWMPNYLYLFWGYLKLSNLIIVFATIYFAIVFAKRHATPTKHTPTLLLTWGMILICALHAGTVTDLIPLLLIYLFLLVRYTPPQYIAAHLVPMGVAGVLCTTLLVWFGRADLYLDFGWGALSNLIGRMQDRIYLWADPTDFTLSGGAYQPLQAAVALLQGGLWGFSGTTPSIIDGMHTLAFSGMVLCFGLVFAVGVALLFFAFFWRCMVAADNNKAAGKPIIGTLCACIGVYLLGLTLVHIMVNCGLLPITSVGLPFFSFSRYDTRLLFCLVCFVLYHSGTKVSKPQPTRPAHKKHPRPVQQRRPVPTPALTVYQDLSDKTPAVPVTAFDRLAPEKRKHTAAQGAGKAPKGFESCTLQEIREMAEGFDMPNLAGLLQSLEAYLQFSKVLSRTHVEYIAYNRAAPQTIAAFFTSATALKECIDCYVRIISNTYTDYNEISAIYTAAEKVLNEKIEQYLAAASTIALEISASINAEHDDEEIAALAKTLLIDLSIARTYAKRILVYVADDMQADDDALADGMLDEPAPAPDAEGEDAADAVAVETTDVDDDAAAITDLIDDETAADAVAVDTTDVDDDAAAITDLIDGETAAVADDSTPMDVTSGEPEVINITDEMAKPMAAAAITIAESKTPIAEVMQATPATMRPTLSTKTAAEHSESIDCPPATGEPEQAEPQSDEPAQAGTAPSKPATGNGTEDTLTNSDTKNRVQLARLIKARKRRIKRRRKALLAFALYLLLLLCIAGAGALRVHHLTSYFQVSDLATLEQRADLESTASAVGQTPARNINPNFGSM